MKCDRKAPYFAKNLSPPGHMLSGGGMEKSSDSGGGGGSNNERTPPSSGTVSVQSTNQPAAREPQLCAGCNKPITERYLLKALDLLWHEDCLKCGCCDCRLGEVGASLFTRANLILCKRDYLRLFGNTGYCAACNKVIPAFEMVMRARNNVYHLECFACQQCNHRFCVGDRFYLCENKILCEYDYEERLVFANMAYHPPPLSHLKRQTTHLPPPANNMTHSQLPMMNGSSGPGMRQPGDLNNNMSGQNSSSASGPFGQASMMKGGPGPAVIGLGAPS